MFLSAIDEVNYSDPWAMDIAARLAALARGTRHVAYFYEKPDNSTFRYRVFNMIEALTQSTSEVGSSYFCLQDLRWADYIAETADVLVICRTRYSDDVHRLITRFRARSKQVIFDVDDLVFDTRFIHLILHTLAQDVRHSAAWDHWFAYIGRIGATLQLADSAIATNDFLAERIRNFAGVRAEVIPNFLNEMQLDVSHRIFHAKAKCGFARDESITLGYFSGTPTHNNDLAIVVPALSRLFNEDQRLRLMIVGYMDLPTELQDFGDRILRIPFQDFVNLQRYIGQVEINLVPLQSNTFTNCKSELKYVDAGAVGTLTIASPTHTYASAITQGHNGFCARDHEWVDVIQHAVDTIDELPHLARAARTHTLANFDWRRRGNEIVAALGV